MCLECKLHLSTHTYTAKYVSCNVSFFLQIFLVLDQKSCLAVQLRLRLLEPHFIHTHQQAHHSPPTCSKWAKSMVKWARAHRTGNKHQLRRRHSTSQPVRIGTKGLKKKDYNCACNTIGGAVSERRVQSWPLCGSWFTFQTDCYI